MGCNCAKRGEILSQAATAYKAGNYSGAIQRVGTVAASLYQDAKSLITSPSSSTTKATPYRRSTETITRI